MKLAAIYALGATALAVGLVLLLHRLEPEFDPSWRLLSEYSLGRYGVLMRAAFLSGGTAVIAVAIALAPSAWPWSLGLLLVAVGPLAAAFVDTDPITTPRAEMSTRSNVHAVLGALFILGFPVAATVAGISTAGDPKVGPVLAWFRPYLGSRLPGSSGRLSGTDARRGRRGAGRPCASAGPTA